jgi:hypothetical protein
MIEQSDLKCFLRINKNAGTTICHILRQNYAEGTLLETVLQGRKGFDGKAKTVDGLDEDVHQFINEVQSRCSTLTCIAVNLPFGLHKAVDRPFTYFTLLREPVSRCISYWHFAYRTREEGRLWTTLAQHGFDIRRICAERAAYQFTNDQVRMVSGSSEPEPGETEFRLACENIEQRFVFAGAVELFDRSLQVLGCKLGWSHVPSLRLNATSDDVDASILPPGAVRRFREVNEWDTRLYEWLINKYLPRRMAA